MPKSRLSTLAAYGFGRRNAFSPPTELQFDSEIYRQLNDVVVKLPIPPKAGYLVELLAVVIIMIVAYTTPVTVETNKDPFDKYQSYQSKAWARFCTYLLVITLIELVALVIDVVMTNVLASRLRKKCAVLAQTYPQVAICVKHELDCESFIIYLTILRVFFSPLKVSVNWRQAQPIIYVDSLKHQHPVYLPTGQLQPTDYEGSIKNQPPVYLPTGQVPPPGYMASEKTNH